MMIPMKGLLYDTLTGHHHQSSLADMRRPPCADIELNAAECMEAYGLMKGFDVCYKYLEDLRECKYHTLADAKVMYMRYIKTKKIASGEIPWEERKAKPIPYDGYIDAAFFP